MALIIFLAVVEFPRSFSADFSTFSADFSIFPADFFQYFLRVFEYFPTVFSYQRANLWVSENKFLEFSPIFSADFPTFSTDFPIFSADFPIFSVAAVKHCVFFKTKACSGISTLYAGFSNAFQYFPRVFQCSSLHIVVGLLSRGSPRTCVTCRVYSTIGWHMPGSWALY